MEIRDREPWITDEPKEEEHAGVVHRQTQRTGKFSFRTTLPGEVDTENIEATPRRRSAFGARAKAEESKPRKIEIK